MRKKREELLIVLILQFSVPQMNIYTHIHELCIVGVGVYVGTR